MTRLTAAIGMVALVMAFGTVLAHDNGEMPPHGHILLLGLDGDDVRHCVDLAAGRALPLNAHHDRVHVGRAGRALARAGHAVAPTAPLTPWDDCAGLFAYFEGS